MLIHKEISVQTSERNELIDITKSVEKEISEKDLDEGLVNIFVPHATAGVTINENADPNLPKDISNFLSEKVFEGKWLHDKIDGNADSHIKSSIIGNSVIIPVQEEKMLLGRWQDIFLCEFDGPRKRKIILSLIKNQ